jgi:hypothetical protein
MKYSKITGILAAIVLVTACFLPWTYYPDLDKTFNGFFSEGNAYGRPGKVFIFLTAISILLFLIPRIWAKRANLVIGGLILGYGVKNYLLFTGCYNGVCPEKRIGIFIVLISALLIVVACLLPDLKLKKTGNGGPD